MSTGTPRAGRSPSPTSTRNARRAAARGPAARPRRAASAGRSRRAPSRRRRRSRPGRRSGATGGAGRSPRGAAPRRGAPRRRGSHARSPWSAGRSGSRSARLPRTGVVVEAACRRGQRLGGRGVGFQVEHEFVVGDRGGQRQGVVLVVLILRLLELLGQQLVARGLVEIGVSGPGFARGDVAHSSATLRGWLSTGRVRRVTGRA